MNSMRSKVAGWLPLAVSLLVIFSSLTPNRQTTADLTTFDMTSFGMLPVLEGGRVKPMDSVARNSLVFFRGKQRALDAEGKPIPAIQWLADVVFDRQTAAGHRVFRVDDPDLLGMLGTSGEEVVHFSYLDLRPQLGEIDRQARLAPEEAAMRSRFHKSVIRLRAALIHYQNLETALVPHLFGNSSTTEAYSRFESILPKAGEIMQNMQNQDGQDPEVINDFVRLTNLFRQVAESQIFFAVPTPTDELQHWNEAEWKTPGTALLNRVHGEAADPVVDGYGELADSWLIKDAATFTAAAKVIQSEIEKRIDNIGFRTWFEFKFNQVAPFLLSLQLYVIAFLAVCIGWLANSDRWVKASFMVICLGLIPHTAGIIARVYLSGYAPVTNLYSSAIFLGWGSVAFALPLERYYRNGMAVAAAALTGVCSLIVAHNLAMAGGADTMEMMRAVLDSNFWLSTHVITIVIGYSATFLAASLGLFFILRSLLPHSVDPAVAASLERMVYAVTCFALLFSFVGTVLGGIWADQSWGRFWGWDPKENGALMIVIWTAMMLHAKRIRMVGRTGFMQLAIGGGIVTSWSWFGTNLLGVGLHSYGFMDRGFFWLMIFWSSQLLIILLAATPLMKVQGDPADLRTSQK